MRSERRVIAADVQASDLILGGVALQLNGIEWSWGALNTLCWAIGSISGSMVEEQENRFLVTVIRDLLNLCEITRGKDNKAVIASNIMCACLPALQQSPVLRRIRAPLARVLLVLFKYTQALQSANMLRMCLASGTG